MKKQKSFSNLFRCLLFMSVGVLVSCNGNNAKNDNDVLSDSLQDECLADSTLNEFEEEEYEDYVYEGGSTDYRYEDELIIGLDIVFSQSHSNTNGNIEQYMNYLINDSCLLVRHEFDRKPLTAHVMSLAHELQTYKEGTRKYFPAEHLRKVMKHLLLDYTYMGEHGAWCSPESWRQLLFVPRFLQFSASICPDINFMADVCSADHRVGVMNIDPGYNYYSKYAFLITKAEEVAEKHKVLYLENVDCTINHIRKITPRVEEERDPYGEYYLLTSEEGLLTDAILLICLYKDGRAKVCDFSSEADYGKWQSDYDYDEKYEIYFNPKELCWTYCKPNKQGRLEQVKGTKPLYLNLKSMRVELR